MVYKYEKLGEELIKILKQRKKNGEKTTVIRASEVKHLLDIQKICGLCQHERYPMICLAMVYAADRFQGKQIAGVYQSSTFTVEYQLSLF